MCGTILVFLCVCVCVCAVHVVLLLRSFEALPFSGRDLDISECDIGPFNHAFANIDDLLASYASSDEEVASKEEAEENLSAFAGLCYEGF